MQPLYYNTDMREYSIYVWVGVWLLLVPFFGIPGTWKDGLIIFTALCVVVYSYIGYRRMYLAQEGKSEVFEEDTTAEVNESSTASVAGK